MNSKTLKDLQAFCQMTSCLLWYNRLVNGIYRITVHVTTPKNQGVFLRKCLVNQMDQACFLHIFLLKFL